MISRETLMDYRSRVHVESFQAADHVVEDGKRIHALFPGERQLFIMRVSREIHFHCIKQFFGGISILKLRKRQLFERFPPVWQLSSIPPSRCPSTLTKVKYVTRVSTFTCRGRSMHNALSVKQYVAIIRNHASEGLTGAYVGMYFCFCSSFMPRRYAELRYAIRSISWVENSRNFVQYCVYVLRGNEWNTLVTKLNLRKTDTKRVGISIIPISSWSSVEHDFERVVYMLLVIIVAEGK